MLEARHGQSSTSVNSHAVAPGDTSQGEGIQPGGGRGRKEVGLPGRVRGSEWCGWPMRGCGEARRKDEQGQDTRVLEGV